MLDGYQRSYDKMVKLGAEEVNKYGLYLRFVCQQQPQTVEPETKSKGSPA